MNAKKGNVRYQRRIPAGMVEEVDRYIAALLGRHVVGRETCPLKPAAVANSPTSGRDLSLAAAGDHSVNFLKK